jgi:tetratricopeptide (TPR) repeat protein
VLREAIATYPDRWNGYQWLGLLHFHRARYAEAVEAWQHALEHVPENARTLANLGAAYFRLGQYEQTVTACERSLRAGPSARALANLGTALTYLGRNEEAIAAFEKAVVLQPGDPTTWGNLGSACRLAPGFQKRGRDATERAILLMRDRLTSTPEDAKAWALLACWQANLGARKSSADSIERAVSLGPDDLDVLVAGIAVYQASHPGRAILFLRRALERGYRLEVLLRSPALQPLFRHPDFVASAPDLKNIKEAK